MKIFHLSDLHIGLKLIEYDMREDQEYILNQIVKAAEYERPDVIVIAGDIYDRAVPSADAVEVFDDFITNLTAKLSDVSIMMISGNHDSMQRIDCFRSVLKKHNIYMIGVPPMKREEYIEKVILEDEFGPVNFYLLPFVRPSMVKNIILDENEDRALGYDEAVTKLIGREDINISARNVIVSHQFYVPEGESASDIERMDTEIKSVGNIDAVSAKCLEVFDYAALGHIHKPMKVGSEKIRYSGTPAQYSVSEKGQQKGIVVVELKDKSEGASIRVLPLKPLREVRVIEDELENVIMMNGHNKIDDYVRVIITDKDDINVIDMQERLRDKFPHLLGVERKSLRQANYDFEIEKSKIKDPFSLCLSFMPDIDDESKDILREIINSIKEEP